MCIFWRSHVGVDLPQLMWFDHDQVGPFSDEGRILTSNDLIFQFVHVQNWLCIWRAETSDFLIQNLLELLSTYIINLTDLKVKAWGPGTANSRISWSEPAGYLQYCRANKTPKPSSQQNYSCCQFFFLNWSNWRDMDLLEQTTRGYHVWVSGIRSFLCSFNITEAIDKSFDLGNQAKEPLIEYITCITSWVSELGFFLGHRLRLIAFDRQAIVKEHQMFWNTNILEHQHTGTPPYWRLVRNLFQT